ncbi:iron-sulfur cluster assembly scaffold protein [Mesoterricola sediminis]|uniref:NIF system FeS cluster assembly NifU N-terminal domain-containing protein n=1 Tax=Mesoterricola sediminis TaxID=2927980 RepID=A0AA48KGD1_9BACT|nr:iron-sulfur cluster assembly scaffold protein [Mesoterricola sediminis]BDU77318.1 hypothetical protein METESE_22760 [Mesoterricola sediminis]
MVWIGAVGARIVPANFGPLRGHHAHARVEGSCGDTMEMWAVLDGPRIVRASFTSDGCETSVACGSAAAHLARGLVLDEVRRLRPLDVLEALGIADGEEAEEAHHCADLALTTLVRALQAPVPAPSAADAPR